MLWPQNNNALALRKQSLVRQDKISSFYSIEDLRQKLPISTYVNPYATRLVRTLHIFGAKIQIWLIYHLQVVLCKDGDGKVGLRVKAIDKGIFVALVAKGSPASMGGLKFGDQILQINNVTVAGFTAEKVHTMFKACGVNNIVLAVRDR